MESGPDDDAAVTAQIGRAPRGGMRVARRCHHALPVVLEVAPRLPTGEPFPTLYWLSCPLAHRRVARLEAAGGVREMDRRVAEDPEFRDALERATARYASARAARAPNDGGAERALRGGVGGAVGGTKCLHAHFAHHLVDGANPVGAAVAPAVEPLDCGVPCVVADGASARRNPAWSEPARPDGD